MVKEIEFWEATNKKPVSRQVSFLDMFFLTSVLCILCAAAALEKARQEWDSKRKDEVDSSLESSSSQLVKQFEKQTKEAVEKAVGDARVGVSISLH